jgi:uncharacterized protein YegJ (DUF2314 family)
MCSKEEVIVGWRNRTSECSGSVLFRGTVPPRFNEFTPALKQLGVKGQAQPAGSNHWSMLLGHPQWGKINVVCLRDVHPPPAVLIDWDRNLNAAERLAAKAAGCMVSFKLEGGRGDVLRDRKTLLRWMYAFMGDDGLVAMDHTAQRFWSRESLADELAHDADLDVQSLYTVHVITGDEPAAGAEDEDEKQPIWLHTHGLAEMGFFDFDIILPHLSVCNQGGIDLQRAMAFGILEEKAKPGMERFVLATGKAGAVRLIDVETFDRKADRRYAAMRDAGDDSHNTSRVVLCDPASGFLAKLFPKPKPSGWLQQEVGEGEYLIQFSDAASSLSASRARATWSRFRDWITELEEFEFTPIVKIAYDTDSGQNAREHLWFEVHEAKNDSVDATLLNQPFDIAAMKEGDRAEHSLENMSDWSIISPIGMITPRDSTPLRIVRENKDKLREILAQSRLESPQQ